MNVWVKLARTLKLAGKDDTAVNFDGIDESTEHGKPSVKKDTIMTRCSNIVKSQLDIRTTDHRTHF